IQMSVPAGTMLTQTRAQEIAMAAQRQLTAKGYANARITWNFAGAAGGRYDLLLHVVPGTLLRLKITGETSLHPRPKVYSAAAIGEYAARVQGHYIELGYYDAVVRTTEEVGAKDATVNFAVTPGAFHRPIDMRVLCGCLFDQRRDAERKGILDFSAHLDESGVPTVESGRPYTVGRITFLGHPHYSDTVIRRHFLLDEGVPLDNLLLRRSVTRLNASGLFEPVDEHGVRILTDQRTGTADIVITLRERQHGAWNFAGPLPLSASISARLPAWGRGLLELSTYTVSFHLLAYSSILKLTTGQRFLPVLALERGFLPGAGWLSGFSYSPQIPWKYSVMNYGFTQFEQRIGPRLAGTRGPDLMVTFERSTGEAGLLCEAPRPRFHTVRTGAGIALHLVRTLASY
ncbi:MAG: outer membrane protein/protective antigen OMA87-like protein, partial [Candidatus Solibacter sp.]|nr:outer membrane protein/protective antigen OMA87-like protein [Candidatus Solibacter sp.]